MSDHRDFAKFKKVEQQYTAVCRYLVMDQQGNHYKRMKTAIWLFLYLLLHADKKTGLLSRKIKVICSETGINRNTILRWLNTLRKHEYITTRNTGRGLFIQIREWESLTSDVADVRAQNQQRADFCSEEIPTPENPFSRPNELDSNKKPADPIDISNNKNILKIDIDKEEPCDLSLKTFKQFKPANKQQLLALDLARELNDHQGLPFYLSCCKKYPESLLREVLGHVKEIPSEIMKKSRAALFNHLIRQYDRKDSPNSSH